MGLMDKMKSQANVLAEKAQESAKLGQDRLSQMQAKRQSDALLAEYGAIVYRQRAGRAEAGADDRITELTAQIEAFEAANGPIGSRSAP